MGVLVALGLGLPVALWIWSAVPERVQQVFVVIGGMLVSTLGVGAMAVFADLARPRMRELPTAVSKRGALKSRCSGASGAVRGLC